MGATPARDTNEAAATRDAEARPEPSVAELAPAPAAAPAGAVGVPPIDPRYASQAQSLLARRMLAMQAHAGNAATQRLARQAAPGGLATSQAESIARRLEDAMSGWGTDEEAIYGALSGRTAADMVVIRQAYQRLFRSDRLISAAMTASTWGSDTPAMALWASCFAAMLDRSSPVVSTRTGMVASSASTAAATR